MRSGQIFPTWQQVIVFACFSGLATPVVAAAQDAAPAPQKFGDWELVCLGPAPCRLSQHLAVKDDGRTVFAVTLLAGEKKGELVGVVSLPLGGYIAPGIELRIDGGKPYKLLVETCNASGCHAGFPISAKLGKELGGKQAVFRIWTAKAKPADITVSLAGLAKGMTELRDRGGR